MKHFSLNGDSYLAFHSISVMYLDFWRPPRIAKNVLYPSLLENWYRFFEVPLQVWLGLAIISYCSLKCTCTPYVQRKNIRSLKVYFDPYLELFTKLILEDISYHQIFRQLFKQGFRHIWTQIFQMLLEKLLKNRHLRGCSWCVWASPIAFIDMGFVISFEQPAD